MWRLKLQSAWQFGVTRPGGIGGAIRNADCVALPEFFIPDAINAVWRHHKVAWLNLEQCEKVRESALSLPEEFVAGSELYREAYSMAALAERPVYDIYFLVLAGRNMATLVSADRELLVFSRKHNVRTFPGDS